ncbi:hypothetical protein WA158_003110 [Blastocystis sp. Blastoise]
MSIVNDQLIKKSPTPTTPSGNLPSTARNTSYRNENSSFNPEEINLGLSSLFNDDSSLDSLTRDMKIEKILFMSSSVLCLSIVGIIFMFALGFTINYFTGIHQLFNYISIVYLMYSLPFFFMAFCTSTYSILLFTICQIGHGLILIFFIIFFILTMPNSWKYEEAVFLYILVYGILPSFLFMISIYMCSLHKNLIKDTPNIQKPEVRTFLESARSSQSLASLDTSLV